MVSSCCRALWRARLHNGQTGSHHPQRPVRVASPRAAYQPVQGNRGRKGGRQWCRLFTFSHFGWYELIGTARTLRGGSRFFGGWGIIFVFVHIFFFVLLSNLLLSCKRLHAPLISSKHPGISGIRSDWMPSVKRADKVFLFCFVFNCLSVSPQKEGDERHANACIICQSGASS